MSRFEKGSKIIITLFSIELGAPQIVIGVLVGLYSLFPMIFAIYAGNRRIYHADPDGIAALRAELDRFWSQTLATFKEVVEQETEEVE